MLAGVNRSIIIALDIAKSPIASDNAVARNDFLNRLQDQSPSCHRTVPRRNSGRYRQSLKVATRSVGRHIAAIVAVVLLGSKLNL